MKQDFSTALLLLAVGMITVFFILALIVLLGGWLIKLVNKYAPAPPSNKSEGHAQEASFDTRKTAAIVAAVEAVTGGQGSITKIQRRE